MAFQAPLDKIIGFKPSPQKVAALEEVKTGKDNLLVIAVAGAGKSTFLVDAVGFMKGWVALLAYNKSAGDELGAKITAKGFKAWTGTFHSIGFSAWRQVAKNVKVDDKKIDQIMIDMDTPTHIRGFVKQCVSLAKQRAIGVLEPMNSRAAWDYIVSHYDVDDALSSDGLSAAALDDMVEHGLDWSRKVLRRSIELDRQVIDFDDMIYAPLIHDVKCFQNDWVLVDEAQDTNPARRALAKKVLKPGGRAIFVGDPHQAIYGFTGADNDALDIIKREFNCKEMPLTVTYRCPKAVVTHAQKWVSHITADETAPEGEVTTMPLTVFDALGADMLDAKSAVLCRNTAPLVDTAFKLIRRGIPCHVEGRDIGRSLLSLANKWKISSLDKLRNRLEKYLERETARFMAKGQEERAEALADRVATLNVIMDSLPGGSTIADLENQINKLFGDVKEGQPSPNLTLSTVHKSKGREWDRVYLYQRNAYMPSKYARQAWQMEQELNLIYVAVTRAKGQLIEVENITAPKLEVN